jgi:hypothetical protein
MTTQDERAALELVLPEAAEPDSDAASARAKPLPLRLPLVPPDPPPEFVSPTLAPARMINEVLYCERRM